MNYLIIINDGPYGTEKPYNAQRLAMYLQKIIMQKLTLHYLATGLLMHFPARIRLMVIIILKGC